MIPRPSEGTERLEVVNGLEEVRLSLSVFADDGYAIGWKVQLLFSQVPEMPDLEPTQVHGGRPGRIPFSIKKSSGSRGSWLPRLEARKAFYDKGFRPIPLLPRWPGGACEGNPR